MRDIFHLRLFVKIFHRFAAELLVLDEVEITPSGDAFEFLSAKREFEKDIHRGLGVMRQFFRLLPIFDERVARETDALVKADAFLDPLFVPRFPAPTGLRRFVFRVPSSEFRNRSNATRDGFDRFVRSYEELKFHLLELARAESEVARIDFIAKGLANLANAKGNFLPRNLEHIFELGEDGLGGMSRAGG